MAGGAKSGNGVLGNVDAARHDGAGSRLALLAPMYLTHLECPRCSRRSGAGSLHNLCPCGSPLLARYDLDAVRRAVSPPDIAGREANLWRYRELLPVTGEPVTMGEGCTPILPARRYGARIGVPRLLVKDDGLLPTGSFKARGAAVGVTMARELGARHVAMPTNGNAGAAWAAYAARAGLRATIAIPAGAPTITRHECAASGAEVLLVDGLISDAGRLIAGLVADSDGKVFNTSTFNEPYRVEGKKTMGLEIVEQLGWRAPDVIVYPTGGGVGLVGIHKALIELRDLGWIREPLPRLVAVQSTGCAPVVRAFDAGVRKVEPWPDARTIAFGLTVPAPIGDELILDALYDTGGCAIAVSDEELLDDLQAFSSQEGLLLCPEGAACLTATRHLRACGWLTGQDQVVALNTGTVLKYPDALAISRRSEER